MYHKKTKYRIVLVVVLAMLLQIIGPVAQTAYAEIMESKAFSFQIVGQEDGSGRYEWSYNPEKAKGKTEFEIKLRQKLVMDFSDLLIDSETGEVVGEFTISKDGILTARIYEVEVELEPEEIPEEPVEEEEEVEGEGEEEAEDEGQADEAGEPDEDDEEDPEQEIEDDIVEEEGFKDEADKIEINDITVQIDQDVKVTVTAKVTGVEENQKARVEILNHEGLVVEVKEELEVEGEQLIAEFDSLGPDRFQARVTVGEVVGLSEEFDLVEAEEETSEDEEVEDNGEDGEEVADEAEEDLGDKELSFFGKSIASLAMAWGNLENLFLAGADPDEEPLEPSSGGGMIPFGFMIMGGEDDGDLGNIFTDVSLEVDINDSGTFEKIDEDTNKRLEITEDTAVLLKYSWELENSVDLQDRDYSSIQIPNVFSGFIGALTGNLIATVDGTMNVIVGGFEIAGSTLTATFNNMLVGKEDRFGEVWAYFKFDPVVLNENAYQVIKFEDNINKEFIITAVPKGGSANITKAGSPDKELNASYISWSIDVNVKLEDLENGKIVDLIPEGLGEAYEVKIYDLTIGADGSIGQYLSETNPQPSYTSAGNKLTVNLGETNTAYRIEYKTKILDHSLATGKENIAHLIDKDDEYNPLGTGKWEVQQLEVGSTIDKEGSANNSGTNSDKITWTIDVNKAQLDLENVSVEDTFTEKTGHTLNISEIRIFKINEKGVVKGGNIASEYSNPTSFPITLGNLKNQAIRIEYDTSIIYNEYKSKDNIFKNQATLKLNGTQSGSPVEAEVNVSRLTLIEKNGVEGTAYDAPYIDWTIHVNKAKHTIKSATVTDVIGAGLKLDGEIKVYVGDSNTEYDSGKYTVNPKTDNGFKVTFTDSPITDYYTIKYRTKITNPGESLKNEAELYGNGLVGDGVGVDPDLGIIKTGEIGPSNTVNNSYTKSTYDSTTPIDGVTYGGLNHTDKTMSWKLIVDAKKEVVTELTISEIFDPANTMVFLEDSLRVRKGSSDILTKDTDYTLTDNKAGGFVLEFIGDHKPLERDKYEIYYKTSFDPNVILTNGGSLNNSKTYKNTVSFVGKTKDITNVETVEKILGTDTKQYDINDVVSKGGKKDGVLDRPNRKISWKVYANALSQDLSGTEFVITDTLSPFKYDSSGDGKSGHELDGAIVVKTYSLNKDGTINPGSEITSGYTITYKDVNGDNTTDPSEAKQFIISFAGGVDKPIMIEYNTKITGISANKYYNSATITGKDGLNKTYEDDVTYDNHSVFIEKTTPATEVFTDDEIEWELTLNKSLSEIDAGAEVKDILSDGLVYLSGSLAIKDYSNNPLIEGSDYSFNSTGNTLTITFTNKMTEMYTITYKTAVIAGKGVNITNNASFQGESTKVTDSSGKTFEVKQYSGGTGSGVSRGSIKIIKVDANDSSKKLKDAEFEIYYLLNGEKQIVKDSGGNDIHKTDNNGEIFVKGLVFKEYFIKEIKAPTGYVLNTTDTVSRVLSLGVSTQDIELPFENTSKANAKGKIKFIKHGGNSTPLDGAEFTLYTEDGSTPVKDSGGNNIVATSNADGEVEFADVPYGTYTIKETKAPDGYDSASDFKVVAEFETNGATIELIDPVVNTVKKGSIKLKKVDEDGITPLKDAVFNIYEANDGNRTDSKDTATSTSEGIVEFTDMPYGDYVIVETTPPKGYKPADDIEIKWEDFINANGTIDLTTDSTKYIKNIKYKGNIAIIKKGEGENRLSGAKFELFKDSKGIEGTDYAGVTNNLGIIEFENVPYGTYYIIETEAPEDYLILDSQFPRIVTIKSENHNTTQEFIFTNTRKTYAIGDYVWIDANRDGIQDDDEEVLEDVIVELYIGETKVAETTTDSNGRYIFDELESGTYRVKFVLTENQSKKYKFTLQGVGDDKEDSDANPDVGDLECGFTDWFELNDTTVISQADYDKEYKRDQDFKATQGIDPTWDAGVIKKTYAIGDYTWIDRNNNGIQDDGEEILEEVKVEIFYDEKGENPVLGQDGQPLATETDENGLYIFDELDGGDYYIKFTLTNEQSRRYRFTALRSGDDEDKDSDADRNTGWTQKITLDDSNINLTKDYDSQGFTATEGIDPSWDAGVVSRPTGGGTPPNQPPSPPQEPELPTEPEEPELPEVPEEPEEPTVPEEPEEKEDPTPKPFSFLIIEEDEDGDGTTVEQVVEAPVTFRERGNEKDPSKRIRYNPETKRIEVEDLEDGEEIEVVITTTIEDEEIVVGKLKIRKGPDGEPVIEEELIDPYGTISNSKTGDPVGDVETVLFFADTPRNRDRGRVPGTRVKLPEVLGFKPNDNHNPQISVHEPVWSDEAGDHGNYAWLVFPETDYYIVAKKTGYEDYISPILSVEYDIIKHDIAMDPIESLPKTGEASSLVFYLIGLLLIGLGILTRKRRVV